MSSLVSLQHALARHILDGDETIAVSIRESSAMPASTRLRIYSDAYRLRLIEALQANYPLLDASLGSDEFARLAQLYLAAHPSRHVSIRWFGHRLAEFLCEHEEYRDAPWLAELAVWEWAVATAFDAEDAVCVTIEELATLAPEEWSTLRFALHPSVQRIQLRTNAAAIAKAAGNKETLPPPSMLDHGVEWLIWRQDLAVNFRSLDAAEAASLDALRDGATFGELCEKLSDLIDTDEVPHRAAAFLRGWIEAQLLIHSKNSFPDQLA